MFNKIVMLLLLVHSISLACPNNCSGSDNGRCNKDGTCSCILLRSGDDCSDIWRENKKWNITFLFYSLCVVFSQLICAIFAAQQLGVIFLTSGGFWVKWGLVTYILLLGLFGSLFRILEYSIDPHSVRGILTPIGSEVLFNIPLILWLAGSFMLFLYWVELQQLSGIKELKSVSKLKPWLIVFVIATAVIILPAGIANWALGQNLISTLVYNAFFVIAFVILIILSSVYGVKLIRTMNKLYKSTKVSSFKLFLIKVTKYLFFFDGTLVISIITLVIFTAMNAAYHKWLYVGLSFFLRGEEFALVFCTLLFLSKKKPSADESGKISQQRTVGVPQSEVNLNSYSIKKEESYEESESRV